MSETGEQNECGKCAAWRVLAGVRALPAAEAVSELGEKLCLKTAPRAAGGLCGGREGPGTAVLSRGSLTVSSSALQAEVTEGNAGVCLSVCLLRCDWHMRAASVQGTVG